MAIAAWSGRRIAILWIIGAVCEGALLGGPFLLARRYAQHQLPDIERKLAQMRAEQAPIDERWRLAEEADSISVAEQRREAIAAGQYSVTAQGDTLTAVVRVPSGRPDSLAVAASLQRGRWLVPVIALVLWGSIPVALMALTILWVIGRRRKQLSAAA